jgi:hypothetical protein
VIQGHLHFDGLGAENGQKVILPIYAHRQQQHQ